MRYEIPEAAIEAAAKALFAFYEDDYDRNRMAWEGFIPEAKLALAAALPHLVRPKRPRIVCWACGRDVVRRDDGTPAAHIRGDGRGGQCHGAHHHGPRRPTRYRQPSRPYRTPPET